METPSPSPRETQLPDIAEQVAEARLHAWLWAMRALGTEDPHHRGVRPIATAIYKQWLDAEYIRANDAFADKLHGRTA